MHKVVIFNTSGNLLRQTKTKKNHTISLLARLRTFVEKMSGAKMCCHLTEPG